MAEHKCFALVKYKKYYILCLSRVKLLSLEEQQILFCGIENAERKSKIDVESFGRMTFLGFEFVDRGY